MDAPALAEMWERFDELMAQIAGSEEPYWLGVKVLGCVLDAITESATASRVYRLWADLTDRYELRPEERDETDALMRRAASEWLAVDEDNVGCETYLDRWLSRPG